MSLFTKQRLISKTNLWLSKGKCNVAEGRDKSGAWEEHTHITIYKIDDQQGPTKYHRELYLMFCDDLYKKRI